MGQCFCPRDKNFWVSDQLNSSINIVVMNMGQNRSDNSDEKQVFLDTIANYLLDIDFNDAFRYTLAVND